MITLFKLCTIFPLHHKILPYLENIKFPVSLLYLTQHINYVDFDEKYANKKTL